MITIEREIKIFGIIVHHEIITIDNSNDVSTNALTQEQSDKIYECLRGIRKEVIRLHQKKIR